jgi:hypothetical protein
MNKIKLKSVVSGLLAIALVLGFVANFNPQNASAATLSAISDTMSNQTISVASSNKFKLTTPTGIAASQTFIITFPSGFNLTSSVATDVTASYGATTGAENALTVAASPN